MKDKKNVGYRVGQALGAIVLTCIAALAATACIVPTVKIIMWAFSFI